MSIYEAYVHKQTRYSTIACFVVGLFHILYVDERALAHTNMYIHVCVNIQRQSKGSCNFFLTKVEGDNTKGKQKGQKEMLMP